MEFKEFEKLVQDTFEVSLDTIMVSIAEENEIQNDEGDDIEDDFKEKIATYEVVESYDRDLFDTETEYWVVKFTTLDGTVFFVRIDGYYNSWDSTDYSSAEAYEVVKKRRVVEEWVTPETQSTDNVIYLD